MCIRDRWAQVNSCRLRSSCGQLARSVGQLWSTLVNSPAALFNSCRLRSSCGQLASSAGQLWLAVVPAASVNSGQLLSTLRRAPLSLHARPDSRLKSGKRTMVTQTNSGQLRPKLDPARQSPPSPRRGQKDLLLRSICKPMLRCRPSRRPSFLNGHRATRRG